MNEIEINARQCDPHLWASSEPDLSTRQMRQSSLQRARVRLGLDWFNPVTERYELVQTAQVR